MLEIREAKEKAFVCVTRNEFWNTTDLDSWQINWSLLTEQLTFFFEWAQRQNTPFLDSDVRYNLKRSFTLSKLDQSLTTVWTEQVEKRAISIQIRLHLTCSIWLYIIARLMMVLYKPKNSAICEYKAWMYLRRLSFLLFVCLSLFFLRLSFP